MWGTWVAAAVFHGVVGFGAPFPYTAPRLALLTTILAGAGAAGKLAPRFPPGVVAVGLLWTLPVLWSPAWKLSLFGVPGSYSGGLLTTALCIAAFLVGRRYDPRPLWWIAGLSAVHCLAQVSGVDPFVPRLPEGARAIGLLGSPIDAGAAFSILAAVSPWSWVPVWCVGSRATGSRWAMASIAILVAARATGRARVAILAALLAPMVFAAIPLERRAKDDYRTDVWRVAAEGTTLFGQGPNTFLMAYRERRGGSVPPSYLQAHAHNFVLEAGFSRGAFGLAAVALWVLILWQSRNWALIALLLSQAFNPVSFEVAVLAALLAGRESLRRTPRGNAL